MGCARWALLWQKVVGCFGQGHFTGFSPVAHAISLMPPNGFSIYLYTFTGWWFGTQPRAQHLPAGAAVPAERWGLRSSLSPWHWPWRSVWSWTLWSLFPPLKVTCFGLEQLATWSSTVDYWKGVMTQWHWLMRWWGDSSWFLPLPVEPAPWCSILLCHRGRTCSNRLMLVVVCLRWMANRWKFLTIRPSVWTTSKPSCHLRISSCMGRLKRRLIVFKLCWRPSSLTFGVWCQCVWERKVNDGEGASHLVGAVSGLLLCQFTGLWWLWCPTLFSCLWG